MTKQKYLENPNSCNNLYKDYRKRQAVNYVIGGKKKITQHLFEYFLMYSYQLNR